MFNALTGLRQHTGNWPGKTVVRAEGGFDLNGRRVKLIDLPGTYSLQAGSADEEVARDFVLFGQPDVTVIVVDATRLERNLNLVLQILEITPRVVVCLNLMDEARRHGIGVDVEELGRQLGVPVVPTVARSGTGIADLLDAIHGVATGETITHPFRLEHYPPEVEAAVGALAEPIREAYPQLPNRRWVALRLLNGDDRVEAALRSGDIGNLMDRPEMPDEESSTVDRNGRAAERILDRATALRWQLSAGFHDALTESIYAVAKAITSKSVVRGIK
ncbi:MAG: FeoB small GTPase domain-containing protein, partial [Gemmatimonadota bacterium]